MESLAKLSSGSLGPKLEVGQLREGDHVFPARHPAFPLVIRPVSDRSHERLLDLGTEGQRRFRELLQRAGALLFRGFSVTSSEQFEAVLGALGLELSEDYPLGAAARHRVGRFAMTTTEILDLLPLVPHSELAYRRRRPGALAFYCHQPPALHGETPIFDSRAALTALDPATRQLLQSDEITWCHYYRPDGGAFSTTYERGWPEAFGTRDRREVERKCAEANAWCEWHRGGRLGVLSSTPSVVRHPATGEETLTFQTTHVESFLQNVQRLQARHGWLRNSVLRLLIRGKTLLDGYPFEARRRDGSALPGALFRRIDDVLWDHATVFRWEQGDVLVLDNRLVHHSRLNVVRPRTVYVALGDMHTV